MGITIRECEPKDDDAVGDLLVRAFVTRYAEKMPEVVYTEDRKQELRATAEKRRVATVLVAEIDGRLVGTVTLWPPGAPGSEAWLPDSADLRHLAVELGFEGRGISAALLDETERLARTWKCRHICLHVRRGATGVARTYTTRGYLREPAGDLDLTAPPHNVYLEAFYKTLNN